MHGRLDSWAEPQRQGTDTRLSLAFQDSSPSTTRLALQRSSLHQAPLQHELVFSLLHMPHPQIWVLSGLTDWSASTWKVTHGSPSPGCLVLNILVKGYAFYIWHVILFTPTKDWFYYVYKCFAYMYVCHIHAWCTWMSDEVNECPRTGVIDGCGLPWRSWESIRSLLPKKHVFLTAEQSLWPRELFL